MTSQSMRERAAKVADDTQAECKRLGARHGEVASGIIARSIRALPDEPDPTRAALEECVRAMEEARITIGARTDIMTLTQKECAVNAAWHILERALRTARNALGKGE